MNKQRITEELIYVVYSVHLDVITGRCVIRSRESRVEAGSNTSTVALRVIVGDETGGLESERVKYGRESHGTPLARVSSNFKRQIRPLVR
jgi:hypothetical protein